MGRQVSVGGGYRDGKGGAVNWNEGLHSRWRDKLKRLQLQTKGYTKCLRMLRDSLALVCLRRGLIQCQQTLRMPLMKCQVRHNTGK